MKPIKLDIEAFGPFAESTTVDFRRLDEHALFLIHGPTGSGKSTLFDALCYALFGVTAAGVRDGSEMRSNYADPSDLAKVSLVFKIGPKYFRIERQPSQLKPGNKNETPAKVALYELNGEMEPVKDPITKIKEAGERIEQLLGMTADQFKQIVMLPQGEFRRLLLADTNEREQILARLFQTDLYQRITDYLNNLARESGKRCEKLENEMETLLAGEELETSEELKSRQREIVEQREVKEEKLPGLEKALKKVRKKREKAEQQVKQLDELKAAEQSLKEHEEEQESIQKQKEQLESARRADKLRDPLEYLQRQREKKEQLAQKLKDDRSALEQAQKDRAEREKAYDQAVEEAEKVESLTININKLEELRPKVEEFEQRQQELQAKQEELKKERDRLEEKRQTLETLGESEQKLKKEIPELREQAKSGELEQRVKTAAGQEKAIKQIEKLRSDYRKQQTKVKQALQDLNEQQQQVDKDEQEYKTIRRRWMNSQAVLLAEKLEADQPCPVCGSTEHPQPATQEDETVGDEEHNRAFEKLESKRKKVQQQKQKYDRLKAELDNIKQQGEQLKEQMDEEWAEYSVEQIGEYREHLERQLKKARKAEQELNNAEKQQEKVERRIQKLQQERDEATEKIHKLEQEEQKLLQQVSQVKETLDELEIEGRDDLNGRLKKLREKRDRLKKAEKDSREALQKTETRVAELKSRIESDEDQLESLKEELEELEQNWRQRCSEAGFEDADAVHEAMLEPAELKKLEEHIEAWEKERSRLRNRLEQLEETIGEHKDRPDLESIKEEEQKAEKQWQELNGELAGLKKDEERLKKLDNQLKDRRKQLLEEQEYYGRVQHLAGLATGDNALNQKFQTYVLSVLLDDVASQANLRLQAMSQDRYQLRRVDQVSDGRKKAGLDLNVFDTYNGQERSVRTLSGGEMFITSLALALGLADVAMMRSGGIKMDAIFIDEGFGSLDSETLDLAVRTLMNLKEDGRMVGIISHVEELKERIDTRLEVVKRQDGSRLEWHV